MNSKLKTIEELVHERMNYCSSVLSKKFLKSVRAIYGSDRNGRPSHIGSCVAIKHKEQYYIVTAQHVMEHNAETSLYIGGEDRLILIEGKVHSTLKDNSSIDLDLAIIPLSESVYRKIGDIYYLEEKDMVLRDLEEYEKYCLAIGYPNSKNKYNISNGLNVISEPFIYSSNIKTDEQVYRVTGTSSKYQVLLDFCQKKSKDENNLFVNSTSARGVSGGGLFLIENMHDPRFFLHELECTGKLLGILTEYRKNHRVLVYTKVSVVINIINSLNY